VGNFFSDVQKIDFFNSTFQTKFPGLQKQDAFFVTSKFTSKIKIKSDGDLMCKITGKTKQNTTNLLTIK